MEVKRGDGMKLVLHRHAPTWLQEVLECSSGQFTACQQWQLASGASTTTARAKKVSCNDLNRREHYTTIESHAPAHTQA
jgi:hypothetical protein